MTPTLKTSASGAAVNSTTGRRGAAASLGKVLQSIAFQPDASLSKAPSQRLHRKPAAVYLGVSLSWLDKSRLRGDGPVYLQIGGRVIYDTADLDDYMARHRRRSTSGTP